MKKAKTAWDLGLLYKGDNDPQMELDMKELEKAASAFEKKYKGKDFISSPQKLRKALDGADRIGQLKGGKPARYFQLKTSLNTSDDKGNAKLAQWQERSTKAMNKLTFFYLEVAKVPVSKQAAYMKSPVLKLYAYKLKKVFRHAKHNLAEDSEQLLNLLSMPAYQMWVDGSEKLLNEQTLFYKGKTLPLTTVLAKLPTLPKGDRRKIQREAMAKLKSISHFAESELNAIVTLKKIEDERRNYKQPYSSAAMGFEQEDSEIESLVDLVTKHFAISHRFYKLHARLLKEKKISMADRGVSMGKIVKKFDFDTTVAITREEFRKVDSKYEAMLDAYLSKGQIDVYPRKGKASGGFCAGGLNDEPTFILLNHTDDIRSVETLAHEMGHAFHGELSRSQPVRYQRYSLAVAETASTFFEQVVSSGLEKHLSEKERVILLHNKIMGDVTTIFRQIALFNFEKELHQKVRAQGKLSGTELSGLMAKHLRSYLGPAVEVKEEDGYCFVSWAHIRYLFYVYSYAYGQLVSNTLYARWKKDPSFAEKIEQFLRAGRSMSPSDIFKSIGIDTTDPKFFLDGLKSIEDDIKKLEKLTR